MKFLKLLLFLLIYTDINSQTSAYENLSKLFLDYNFTNKPKQIEKKTDRALFDYPLDMNYDYVPAVEKNISYFTHHPMIKSVFEKGTFNVTYLFNEKYYNQTGQYEIYMSIIFKGVNALKDSEKEFNKLVEIFRVDSLKNYEENLHNGSLTHKDKRFIFYYNNVYTLPKLELNFNSLAELESYKLEFIFTTTWSFKKFKNFVPKF